MRAVRPREMSEGQERMAVKWLTENCDLADLRRRQTLVEIQIREAYEQRNTDVLDDLRAMEKHLQKAVLKKISVDTKGRQR
jgi:hypothetical protein